MSTLYVGSPFALTASPETAACWAGRRHVLDRLNRLIRSFHGRPDSSLDMIWANLGAGKSHALFHLRHLLRESDRVLVSYLEMPEQPRDFVELYRRIVAGFDSSRLLPALDRAPLEQSSDIARAIRAIRVGGSSEVDLAKSWLWGRSPLVRDLRSTLGIGTRIEDDLGAQATLTAIVHALAQTGIRVLILLDEFQRIATSAERYRTRILSNLRSVYSSNATGLSVILGVASRVEGNALELLPGELRTLMAMRPAVSLPEMSVDEAVEFVTERLRFFRPQGYAGDPFAPFGLDTIKATVKFVSDAGGGRLIPRIILQYLAYLYDESAVGIPGATENTIDPATALNLLRELPLPE